VNSKTLKKNTSTPLPSTTMAAQQGVVYRKNLGGYIVRSAGREIPCTLSAALRKAFDGATVQRPEVRRSGARPGKKNGRLRPDPDERLHTDPIVVGDHVIFIDTPAGGQILEISERRNSLSRCSPVPMPSARPYEQVIAANIDQVIPVFAAANPKPRWGMLDRYLVSAEAAGLPALICITKVDLARERDGEMEPELEAAVAEYRRIGYPVLLTSSESGEGLKQFEEALSGRISVLLGKSGVGKSSLLNAIRPGLGLRVNEVSRATGKGMHTTTHLEMFPLDPDGAEEGGAVVDTPGVREFGLWDVYQEDLALFFPEMRPLVGRCKYGLDCRHDEEPGCAIRKAVVAGEISPFRYQSYLRLLLEV